MNSYASSSWLSRAKRQHNAYAMVINAPGLSDTTLCGSNNQNRISWADGEPHGILLRLRGKEHAPLYLKQFSDDSMENTALLTLFLFKFIRHKTLCSYFNQSTLIPPKKEGKKTVVFSTMLP